MRSFLIAALLCSMIPSVYAKIPSQRVIDACLLTETRTAKGVKYTYIAKTGITENEVDNLDNKDEKKTSTVIDIGKDEFGVWKTVSPKAYGLVYNGKEIDIRKVKSLTKRAKPTEIDVGMTSAGIAKEGADTFVCVAFLFEGLGQSGSFQNVRGAYIIDKKAKVFMPYYVVGDIRKKSR